MNIVCINKLASASILDFGQLERKDCWYNHCIPQTQEKLYFDATSTWYHLDECLSAWWHEQWTNVWEFWHAVCCLSVGLSIYPPVYDFRSRLYSTALLAESWSIESKNGNLLPLTLVGRAPAFLWERGKYRTIMPCVPQTRYFGFDSRTNPFNNLPVCVVGRNRICNGSILRVVPVDIEN